MTAHLGSEPFDESRREPRLSVLSRLVQLDQTGAPDVATAMARGAKLDPAKVARDAPDETWVHLTGGLVTGHASLWWRRVPHMPCARVGLIGHYEASDADVAQRVLAHACAQLATRGCTMAIGPMDGSTWSRYRAVTDRGSEPPFFLDLETPHTWSHDFVRAGFGPIAEYVSAVTSASDACADARVPAVRARLEGAGITLRSLDRSRVGQELDSIFDVSCAAFARALLYSAIGRDAFVAQYQDLLPHVDPRLVLMAEHDGRLVGFLCAVPDWCETARGERARTIVVKTLAVRPDRRYAGLGAWLADEIHRHAREQGCTRVVHALMCVSNVSRVMSERWRGRVIRRYALYGRELAR